MPVISLTEFIDFVLKVGMAKVTKVSAVKDKAPYSVMKDHYLQLRRHFGDFHEGKVPELSFEGTGANPKKAKLYKLNIKGYIKFLGKQEYEWFKSHKAKWVHGDLTVNVNPEAGFVLDGKKTLVKLYLKAESLTKPRISVVLGLMRASYPKTYDVAVLDVIRGNLYTAGPKEATAVALLEGEAATFSAIWQSLDN